MKKIIIYLSVLTVLVLGACQDEEVVSQPALKANEYLFELSVSEPVVATRALADQPTAAALQNLHVLVFDENGLFLANQVAANVTLTDATHGTFTVDLPPSDNKRILHFVAGDVIYDSYSRNDSEAKIFGSLNVTNGGEAYWQRVEVSQIRDNAALKAEVGTVQLMRNFAKIELTDETGLGAAFSIEGFIIVNATDAGSVAPYMGGTSGGFADFRLTDEELASGDVYAAFTNKNRGFQGNTAGSIIDVPTNPNDIDWNPDAKYVYERQQVNSSSPAYILLRATVRNINCYYKLDLVQTDDRTYITSYLNLYRNFCYKIRITSVAGVGYSTMEDAMNAAASNNLSASVEVSQINSIEDGTGNKLEVGTTDVILVSGTQYTLTYNYTFTDEDGVVTDKNSEVIVTPVSDTEDGYNHAAVTDIVNNGDGTVTISLVNPLPVTLQTQELILSTPSGLSRRVSVRVRQPYEFQVVDCQDLVKREVGASFVLGVRLPQNMPSAVFPLTLNIEPDLKSIYPNAQMNSLPVEAVGNHSVDYVVTISYTDYRRSPSFYFYFKTNMAASATSVNVSSPYFAGIETVSFENTDEEILGFTPVTFGAAGDTDTWTSGSAWLYNRIPTTIGSEIVLEFELEVGHRYVVGIYNTTNLEFVSSSTGSVVWHESNNGWAYSPNDSGTQRLVFRTTDEFVSDVLQISSLNHELTTIAYRNTPIMLNLKYTTTAWGGSTTTSDVPATASITIAHDANYSDATTKSMAAAGKLELPTISGNLDDMLYFRYTTTGWGSATYSGSITIGEILNGATLTLTRNN